MVVTDKVDCVLENSATASGIDLTSLLTDRYFIVIQIILLT